MVVVAWLMLASSWSLTLWVVYCAVLALLFLSSVYAPVRAPISLSETGLQKFIFVGKKVALIWSRSEKAWLSSKVRNMEVKILQIIWISSIQDPDPCKIEFLLTHFDILPQEKSFFTLYLHQWRTLHDLSTSIIMFLW